MDISLNDLKTALGRALEDGPAEAAYLAGYVKGYLSAGPLEEAIEAVPVVPAVGTAFTDVEGLKDLPVGSVVRDRGGDYWIRYDMDDDAWTWYKYSDGATRLIEAEYVAELTYLQDYFPVTLGRVGY